MAQLQQAEKFERILTSERVQHDVVYEGISFWKEVFLRFKENRGAVVGIFLILLISFMAFAGP